MGKSATHMVRMSVAGSSRLENVVWLGRVADSETGEDPGPDHS